MNAKAITDGRGNAGTGARACVLILETGEIIERAEKIPPTTNIVAEHLAIQLAVEMALDAGVRRLLIWNDSQVPVFQLQEKYQIRQDHLRPIVHQTWELASQLEEVSIEWVPRSETSVPDAMCTAVDKPQAPRKRPSPPAA